MPYIKSTYEYTKARKNFGRQLLFRAGPAQMLDSIKPNKIDQKDYVLRNPVHRFVQATTLQSEHEANTKKVVTVEQGVNHVEGGWPREVHPQNEDAVLRHCRRVTHEEDYIEAVSNLAPVIKHFVNQNNAIELYESYFSNMSPQEPVEKCSIRIANVFRDHSKRPISCIVWSNESNSKIIAAYSDRTDTLTVKHRTPTDCYIWDVSKQSHPIQSLKPEISCWQLAGSPIDPELFVAGLQNGTVNLFDTREGEYCVSSSSVYNSHRGPIISVLYNHSRTNTEFFTGSSDGQCLWWDMRNLSLPLTKLPISVNLSPGQTPNLANSVGISSLNFDHNLPTRFLCGTESGLVINVNRMGKEYSDILAATWKTHVGLVRSIQRSPCTTRMFMTCGDSTVRIWSDEVRTAPIIVSSPYRYEVMDASWAPLRYSSYMSICAGGFFYYWDILRKYKGPIVSMQISNHALIKMTAHPAGHSIAIGDIQGDLHLILLSDSMVQPGSRDKALVSQLYTRETHREHILDNRLKEIRLKLKAEEIEAISLPSTDSLDKNKELQDTEENYFKIVSEELSKFESIRTSSASLI